MLYCDMNTDGGNRCLNKIFIGGGGRSGDTLQISFPLQTSLTFMQPSFRFFVKGVVQWIRVKIALNVVKASKLVQMKFIT